MILRYARQSVASIIISFFFCQHLLSVCHWYSLLFETYQPQIEMPKMAYETYHRRDLYKSCSSDLSTLRGTPYPCSPYDLLSSISISNLSPYSAKSPDEATVELERFLDPSARIDFTVQEAIDRLQAGLSIHDWKPDLVIKAFCDLDIVFFDGKLRGKTTIHWRRKSWWIHEARSLNGHRRELARTDYLGNGKAAIHLNAWGILLDSPNAKTTMWSVVLHEMVVSSYISVAHTISNYTYFFSPLRPYSMPMNMSCAVVPLQPDTTNPVAGMTVTD